MSGFWRKALVYLGLVEEEDELEPLAPESHEPPQLETVRPLRQETEPSGVRRIEPTQPNQPAAQASPTVIPQVRVHVVEPSTFNDAKEIGDRLRVDAPVIMNLQHTPAELAHRLIDFASGLTYMASGSIKKVADRVFLLTPANVEVSQEEMQRISSERGFFNQF